MSESAAFNGLDVAIKTEPDDPLLEIEPPVIPKEFIATNGIHEDSDCEDICYFTQIEVDNTRKCLENTRLIIKDFETQLDWHLQQYMTLRNVFNPKKNSKNGKDDSKRQDLLSISQLSAIIANHPEGNKKFIKRKGPIPNGAGRKRRRNKESDSEDSEFSEDSEEYDEEDFDEEHEGEAVDDPGAAKKAKRARGKKKDADPHVKDEIEEEEHELIEPKVERKSEEKEVGQHSPSKKAKSPRKGRVVAKVTAKRTLRGKKAQMDTVDLTSLRSCKVILNRIDEDTNDSVVEIKSEDFDRDELAEMFKNKCVTALNKFSIDSEKPIVILKDDNADNFDFTECKTSNVVVTIEDKESLPEFVFGKNMADCILNGSITLVQADVFDQHLSEDKN